MICPVKNGIYGIEYDGSVSNASSYYGLARCVSDGPSNEDMDTGEYLYAFEMVDSVDGESRGYAEFASVDIVREISVELA